MNLSTSSAINLKYFSLLGKYILLIKVNKDRIVEDFSQSYEKYFQYKFDNFKNKPYYEALGLEIDSPELYEIEECISTNRVWSKELEYKTKLGTNIYLLTQIISLDDEDGFMILQEDITDKKELEVLSITDELTSLYNRRYFNITLHNLVSSSEKNSTAMGFLILDIDHFKQYNDSYGHPAGDRVLRKLGKVLQEVLNDKTKYIFRIGGEEFGVLFDKYEVDEIHKIAEDVRKAIENMQIEHCENSASKYVTASLGLVIIDFKKENNNASGIYSMADHSLYMAKDSGRNQVVVHQNDADEWF